VAHEPEIALFGLTLLYVISGPILTLFLMRRRHLQKSMVPDEKTV
jgi:hypothetical protein